MTTMRISRRMTVVTEENAVLQYFLSFRCEKRAVAVAQTFRSAIKSVVTTCY